jgi:hypothetical protein
MGVFVSWAIEGSLSHRMALHIKEWLPDVFVGQIECFVSSTDISAGSVWLQELFNQLEESQAGIVCVTRESMTRGWMLFEAGALAKMIGTQTQRVCPLLLDLDPGELQYPLAAFQWKVIKPDVEEASKENILALLKMVNESVEPSKQLEEHRLLAQFQAFWPRLWSFYKEQRAIQNTASPHLAVHVDNREILVEIRSGFRQMLNMLAREQRIEVPVTCPSCRASFISEFQNVPGATRHFTCATCRARFIAHLAADRQASTKIVAAAASGPTDSALSDSVGLKSLQVSCPNCGGSQVESFSDQLGATRHLTCAHCDTPFITHVGSNGAPFSKPVNSVSPTFEGFLRKTQFWIDPKQVASMVAMACAADTNLSESGAIKTPIALKEMIHTQDPKSRKLQTNTFVKIILVGGSFNFAPGSQSPGFYTQYSNSLDVDGVLQAFYCGTVRRLSQQFKSIGEKDIPDLREVLQTETITNADRALITALKKEKADISAASTIPTEKVGVQDKLV